MPRTYALTYYKPRKCWRKKYRGKAYYLGRGGVKKTDEAAYETAVAEWEAIKRYADGEGPEPFTASGEFNPAEYDRRLGEFLAIRHKLTNQATKEGRAVDPEIVAHMASDYARLAITAKVGIRTPSGDVPLTDLFAEYLRQREGKVRLGDLSVKQYAQDKSILKDFEGFAKNYGLSMLSEIEGPTLQLYREAQDKLASHPEAAQRISRITARKRLQTVNKVWRWAYKNEYLDRLPRILDSDYAKMKIERPAPTFWTVDEIRKLFSEASQRTKLYIALACNCGYTQREIASLCWNMIDDAGVITRSRPKSKQPQVHKLWPITLELLRAESKSTTGLCLLSEQGNELVALEVRASGAINHNDAIRLAFNRTLKKCKLESTGRTFKNIRKTSANALAEQFEDNRIVDVFLAHSDRAMRIHYADDHYKKYFAAIDWLESFYDLKNHREPAKEETTRKKV